MSRILSTLAILCLISVASATADTIATNTLSSSLFANAATEVYVGTNTTKDYTSTTWAAVPTNDVIFGPGAANTTIYAYGVIYSSANTDITGVVKRTLNATIIGTGTDAAENAAQTTDTVVATASLTSVTSSTIKLAVGPGYLAILSQGTVGSYVQVQVTIVGTSATTVTVSANTATTDFGSYILGNIFYDIGSGVFFFAYSGTAGTTPANALYVGGVTASTAAVYWAAPGLMVTLATAANALSNIVVGNDNWVNSSNIYVAFKDGTAGISYYSMTTKNSSTTTAGAAKTLATDVTSGTTYPYLTYYPIGVWASSYTYGIATALKNTSASGATPTYTIFNYLNGTFASANESDSGISLSGATNYAVALWGWQYGTGYALLAQWAVSSTYTLTYGIFLGNGSVNATANPSSATTLASSFVGPLNVFEDVNGSLWIGWTDSDTTAGTTYNGWVGRLQAQLNSASSILTTLMSFVAFCLVTVFAF